MSDIVIKLTIDAAQLNTALADVRNKLTDVGAKKVDINTDAAETKIKSLRDNIAMWGLAIQGAVNAFQMVGRAVDSFLKPALEAEAGMTRVRAAVESTGMAAGFTAEQLAEMASQMQEAFALDDDQIMNEITTPLLTFTKITGEAFEQAQVAVANLARTMDGDLKGAALQVGKALNDPTIGLTALQRSGVSFTEQQKEMIKGMWEAGDAAGAQAEILKELNKEFGGQAAAYAESYAGKIESMKLAWGDLVQALGEGLLPILAKVAGALGDVIKWFTSLNGITKAAIIVTPLLTAAWYGLATSGLAASVAAGGLSAALAAASVAVKGFLTSIGLVGWAIMGVGAAMVALGVILDSTSDKLDMNAEAALELQKNMDGVKGSAEGEVEVFRTLTGRLLELKRSNDAAASSKAEMKTLIGEINSKYGDYLGNLDLERASYDQVAEAANKAASAIMQKKLAEGYGALADEQAKEVGRLRKELASIFRSLSASEKQAIDDYFAGQRVTLSGNLARYAQTLLELKRATDDFKTFSATYLKELAKVDPDLETPKKTPSATGGGTGDSGAAAAVSEYEKLMAELEALRQTESEKIDAEWERRYQIIIQNTAEESEERKRALSLLGDWELEQWHALDDKIAAEEEKAQAERERLEAEAAERLRQQLAERAEANRAYYEEVTFADANYYEWKKRQIELEVAALKLEEDAHKLLLDQRLAALDAEKAAYEALPIEEIRDRYDAFKSSMADSSEIGVAAWNSIIEGLQEFRDELEQFAGEPGVNELLEQIEGELDAARARATNKGNWFWSGILGFDPDKAEDQAKIERIKTTFRDLQSQLSNILSMLSTQNQQRWNEELQAMEEKAQFELWSEAKLADEKLKIDEKYEEEQRKIRNAQKAMSITAAIINTAEAVTKALTLGPILGPIMAGAITALGAVQIGLIASQKFASGGLFRGKGGPRDDQNVIMVSDGEYIVNAQSTKRHKHILDAINYGATHATVYPRLAYADGGIAGGGSGMLDAVLRKMDAINMNMSKLETQVAVIVNAPDVDVQVEKHERAKARLQRNGKAFSYGV